MAYKATTNHTLFSLAFSMEVVMPMEFPLPSLTEAVRDILMEEALVKRLVDLE